MSKKPKTLERLRHRRGEAQLKVRKSFRKQNILLTRYGDLKIRLAKAEGEEKQELAGAMEALSGEFGWNAHGIAETHSGLRRA